MIQKGNAKTLEANLVLYCAGDKSLFDDCQLSFDIIAKYSKYLGKKKNVFLTFMEILNTINYF